jgi:hypothetical protein
MTTWMLKEAKKPVQKPAFWSEKDQINSGLFQMALINAF